jgi:DNA polymerase III subunit epsilon
MSGYLILDTETTGLFDNKRRSDEEGQPRLASAAMIFVTEELETVHEYHMLVQPHGWIFDDESKAAQVNGLTHAKLAAEGVPILDVLSVFNGAIDDGGIVVCHGTRHDLRAMRAELRRAGLPDRFEETKTICTMNASAPIVGLKRKNGAPKWPTLQEAYEHFTRGTPDATPVVYHNALADARCTLGIFRRLKELNALPKPKVFYARGKEPDVLSAR